MSTQITLTLDSGKYNVLRCSYGFNRDVDYRGRPKTGMLGGDIKLVVESTDDDFLWDRLSGRKPRPVSGHQLGMVSDGMNKSPDAPPFHYTGRGHKGNHCHCGLLLKSKYESTDAEKATCVMFGAVSLGRTSFCIDCKTTLKKLDLSIM